jgi:transposase
VEKKLSDTLAALQAAHPSAQVQTWAQDEARLGLQPIIRRVWTRHKHRPLARCSYKRKWLYLYAFVHPESGQTEWLILPRVRTDVMSLVLAEFASLVGASATKQIVLVLDNAGWHTSTDLVIPEGIHLEFLPPHTPELQPAERLWPLVRESLANTSFADLDALEARLVERCQKLTPQREMVGKLTHYHWWPRNESGLSSQI